VVDISGQPTLAYKVSKHPSTTDAAAITDGTAMSNTTINPTSVTITASGVGLKTVVTGFSQRGSLLDLQEAAANFGRALINKMDVDGCSILDNFSTTAGSTGVDMSVANALSAIYSLELANEFRDPVFILHPIQISDLRSAIVAASNGHFFAGDPGSGGIVNNTGIPNFKGYLFGVPVYSSSNVPSVNSDADRGGALLSKGRALKWVWKWMPTVETLAAPSYGAGSIELAVSACYGFGEVFDGAGVSIITDHE